MSHAKRKMKRKNLVKHLAFILAFVLTLNTALPMTAYATETTAVEESTTADEDDATVEDATVEDSKEDAAEETTEDDASEVSEEGTYLGENEIDAQADEEEGETREGAVVADWDTFFSSLKTLEEYADEYAKEHAGEDEIMLVLNYIRTGVERYASGFWITLAGEENTAFTAYVAEKDKANGTNVAGLRSLASEIVIPTGEESDVEHMFGCMNLTWYMAQSNPARAQEYADLSGWGGDIADLMEYVVDLVEVGDIDTMADEIRTKYLGVDDEVASAFGILDIRSDLDALYIINNVGNGKTISTVMSNYFNKYLTDEERAVYYLDSRFDDLTTKADIRDAVYSAYKSNEALKLVESDKHLANVDKLREASCYAFADYIYELAKDRLNVGKNDYYTVFDTETSTLAPGVTQEIKMANTVDDKQIVYYVATADVTRSDLTVMANYKDNDGSVWGMQRVMEQMQAAIKNHTDEYSDKYIANFTPVVGVNADFYNMTTGEPSGALVMEGVKYHSASGKTFFAILKDGTPVLGDGSDWTKYEDQVQEAVGGSVWLVKDGKIAQAATSDYYNDRHSRTCVGITKDNKVVLMVLDGRQEPFSAGGSFVELAQIMLDAGCVSALNLDGGGSTTFVSKEEGEDELAVINNPSDGFERSVSSSLMIVSTAKSSTEFSHARVTADYDYLTVGTSVEIEATGVSASGGSADLPMGAYLKVSDESIGTLSKGVFTAKKTGSVDIQVVTSEGTVVGKKTLHVVVPDKLEFTKEYMNAVYGVPTELPIQATYNGNIVKINENDVWIVSENEAAGTIEGFKFTGNESSGIRTVTIGAVLMADQSIVAGIKIDLYNADEAIFDFDDATGGDRQFAWKRTVENTNTKDDITYYIDDLDKDVVSSYIFGLDMKEIQIPAHLTPLLDLLPGGDAEDASAWGFLLQLAERVSVLTNVTVTIKMDENFDVDYSDLTVVNEYFEMSGEPVFDKDTNTLIIKFNWIDQTAAIDPATANSSCILSGIKFTPKEGTEDVLEPVISGQVDYSIYLRANALYGEAVKEDFQKTYSIYPFVNPDNEDEKGGYLTDTLVTFEDTFTIDRTGKEGWVKESDGKVYYYVNNVKLTGVQELPEYLGEGETKLYYNLGEDGVNQGVVTGLFEKDGGLYYAIRGELKTGWRSITVGGETNEYYFDSTGKAVNGEQTIAGYHYTFEDYKLIRGELVKDDKGTRYMWAGAFITQAWVEVDGKKAYAPASGYFFTGVQHMYNEGQRYFVFSEDGFWLEDYTGLYEYKGNTCYVKEGILMINPGPGLVYLNGDYYYFSTSTGAAVKGKSYFVTQTNGLLTQGTYTFDADGKIVFSGDKPTPPDDEDDDDNNDDNPSVLGSATIRIFGANRYETSFKISDTLKELSTVSKYDTVIIASGKSFADALAGSYLAAVKKAPILMASGKNNSDLKAYIQENMSAGGTVYLLGGTAAVPASVETTLAGYNVKRLGGANRYETNLLILNEAGVTNEDILVCTGNDFADSLSASASKRPILLVKKSLTDEQKAFLKDHSGNSIYVIGGTAAVNTTIEKDLKSYGSVERIGGATRFETSVLFTEKFFNNPSTAVLAYAKNFPDGLCGGPLAISLNAPLILTMTGKTTAAAGYMDKCDINSGVVLGGSGLISDTATRTIFGLAKDAEIIEK